MDLSLLKPIGRRVYFVGLIVISLITMGSRSLINQSSGEINSTIKIIPIFLFLGFVKVIWDYKRIRDISTKEFYLLFLLFPIITVVTYVIALKGDFNNIISFFNVSNSGIPNTFVFLGIFSFLNFFYKIFLLFKKGDIEKNKL